MLRRDSLAAAFAALLAACGPEPAAVAPADSTIRSLAVGTWTWAFVDPATQQTIQVETTRKPDQTWTEEAIEQGANGTHRLYARSGDWFVTEGVLKTHTTTLDGVPVGRNSRFAFQTYRVIAATETSLTYEVSDLNGLPGQWPRYVERPDPSTPTTRRVVTIIERRVKG